MLYVLSSCYEGLLLRYRMRPRIHPLTPTAALWYHINHP